MSDKSTKRLNIYRRIESEIIMQVPSRMRAKYWRSVGPSKRGERFDDVLRHSNMAKVDYQIRIGAEAIVPNTSDGIKAGKDRVARIFCREFYGDLISEIHDLREWMFLEGWDDPNLMLRFERLLKLAHGEEVEL